MSYREDRAVCRLCKEVATVTENSFRGQNVFVRLLLGYSVRSGRRRDADKPVLER